MLEGDLSQKFSDSTRLLQIRNWWPAGLYIAEAAGTGAGVTQNHDGGRPSGPAFSNVGAGGLLTHRVKSMGFDQGLCFEEIGSSRCCGTDPAWLSTNGHLMRGILVIIQHHPRQADLVIPDMLPHRVPTEGTGMAWL